MWNEAPDFLETENAMKKLAALRGLKVRKLREIQKREDGLKAELPRNPTERRNRLETLYDELAELDVSIIEAESTVDFNKMRMDMFKSFSFKRA